MKKTITFLLLAFQISIYSQNIQLSEIMKGYEFIGFSPENIQWAPDNSEFYFQWNKENLDFVKYYAYNVKLEQIRALNDEELQTLPIDGFTPYKDEDGGIYSKGPNIYSWKPKSSPILIAQLFGKYTIHSAKTSEDFILSDGLNLFHYQLAPFKLRQITNFIESNSPSKNTESQTFLSEQQIQLFEIIREQEKRQIAKDNYEDKKQPYQLKPRYTEGQYLSSLAVSDNHEFCFYRLDDYPNNPPTHIEQYITNDGYSMSVSARPKVGANVPTHAMFLLDLKQDTLYTISFNQLSGIRDRPEYEFIYDSSLPKTLESDKKIIPHFHGFNDNSSKALIEVKSYDNKDRWICVYELTTNQLFEIDHQHDSAWIGGPGITGWNMVPGNVEWLNNDEFYFHSEESGYSNLLIYNIGQKKVSEIMPGKFEIHNTWHDKKNEYLYLESNVSHPGDRKIYRYNLKTSKFIELTLNPGKFEPYFSNDFANVAVLHSYSNKPEELYFTPNLSQWKLQQVTESRTEEFSAIEWIDPEIITFKAKDGTPVNARLYEPEEAKKNGAAVFFVHGAGYLQNAHHWWSVYYREYMFHNLLVEKGYTVMDIDYRASEGYGRDFRTGIYRFMGGKDLSDYIDAREWLIENKSIDEERIGIYGGSYGGFITLMALLTEPGKFKCGAAIRSVTDWAHYNHPYTSNILNIPEKDSIAYVRSSPIYYAENLVDELLILHGMMDDNVQFQDVVRLTQRFIELDKHTWNIVPYPIEPHGFKETSSWVDEYGRILNLFETHLNSKN